SPTSRLRAETAAPLGESDLGPAWPVPGPGGLRSDFSREAYVEAVERAIEKICAGDIFQVNLSQRLLFPQREPAVQTYRRLRRANPAPFGGFFALPGHILASASPEEFLRLQDGAVSTRPVKGTRPRGRAAEEDAALREELAHSSKDQAENVMIVDLLRNDLSRVARLHTVRVERLFDVETHPTVHHLVSEVRARLRDGLGFADLLRATFPGGSVTGAPKIRAMEIIAELERHARGFYCGSFGWIGFDGALHLNVSIRTLTVARGWIQIPVGGAVTAPSDPLAEYQETLDKAAGMLAALR
ncbi:MAG: aminodeoxychorismate synthase component I, partial [Planctomycetota bacterium]